MNKLGDFLKSLNLEITEDQVLLDDAWHNIEDSDLKQNYKAKKTPNGVEILVHSWRTGETKFFRETPDRPTDPAEYEKWRKEYEAERAKALEEEAITQEANAKNSLADWESYSETADKPSYLEKKKIKAYGVRFKQAFTDVKSCDVVVPCRDINGKLWNLQTIQPDGSKNIRPNKMYGLFHWIGDRDSPRVIYICEGYATGASIHEATGRSVVCAMNAGNLPIVAKLIKDKYPKSKIVIAGDHDRFSDRNPGREKAVEAANLTDKIYVLPKFRSLETRPTDFNDLHLLEGLEAVHKQLVGAALERRDRYNFITFDELLKEPSQGISWVVENYFPESGTSLLSGPPKGGKTTLMRYLMSCVINGEPFLNQPTKQGKVIYLALEEHRGECIRLFKNLSIRNPKNFLLSFTLPKQKEERLGHIKSAVYKFNPSLLVIDTMFKFIKVDSSNDYNPIIEELQEIESLARDSGTHICLIHHSKKGAQGGPVESVLGSQGISAAFDTVLGIKKTLDNGNIVHKLSTESRYAEGIEEHELVLDRKTGVCSLKEIEEKEKSSRQAEEILSYLMQRKTEAYSISDIAKNLGFTNRSTIKKWLISLKRDGKILEKNGERGAILYFANPKWAATVEPESQY